MADHLVACGPRPDLILCSTAARTRQTLAPLLRALGKPGPPISLEKELYLASEDTLLERLRALPDEVETALLIGHNNGIGLLAAALANRGPAADLTALREKYPTGALTILRLPHDSWRGLDSGTCELLAFVRPRDFERH
jgi:phosphohistidine phosphatase